MVNDIKEKENKAEENDIKTEENKTIPTKAEIREFVKGIIDKIKKVEDKRWGFLGRIITTIDCKGGIEKIKQTMIEMHKNLLMGFEEKELVFSEIRGDNEDDKEETTRTDSVQVVFVLPNECELIFYLNVMERNEMIKEVYLKCLNFEKVVGEYQNEKVKYKAKWKKA